MSDEIHQVRSSWDSKANDWQIQVGDDGDWNRRLNSDPVLFEMLGKVRHRSVLDAGCGTGYLSRKLARAGADVIGVDLSAEMIRLARHSAPELDFRIDDCSTLSTIEEGSMDAIVSNYVLMDTPNLQDAVDSMFRVLRPKGIAVLVFSHPCFPQSRGTVHPDESISYHWTHSYYEQSQQQDKPWSHFKTDFLWYHRPLQDYWSAFRSSGFLVEDFREPRMTPDRSHLVPNMQSVHGFRERPMSIAFKLVKPGYR